MIADYTDFERITKYDFKLSLINIQLPPFQFFSRNNLVTTSKTSDRSKQTKKTSAASSQLKQVSGGWILISFSCPNWIMHWSIVYASNQAVFQNAVRKENSSLIGNTKEPRRSIHTDTLHAVSVAQILSTPGGGAKEKTSKSGYLLSFLSR